MNRVGFVVVLCIVGTALTGCKTETVSPVSINTAFDGLYAVDISCNWDSGGHGSLNSHNMNWQITQGKLEFNDYRWKVSGYVSDDQLVFRGQRQSGNTFEWHPLWFTGNATEEGFAIRGNWHKANCKGTFRRLAESVKKESPSLGNARTLTITGSKDFLSIRYALAGQPVDGNHQRPKVTVKLQLPLSPTNDGAELYPVIVIVPSSQGMDPNDEERTARDFRKMGYATALVYSYAGRKVGGDDAETGKTINSVTVAIDALLALEKVSQDPRVDARKAAIYGASKGALSAEETMIMALSEHFGLPRFRVILSENSNMCFDWSQMPLDPSAKLVVFTGEADDSGTLSECVDRTKTFADKGYDIEHIIYPGAAHRFIIDQSGWAYLPRKIDAFGYSKCEWLFDKSGNSGYRDKATGKTVFPQNRQQLKNTIGGCINRGIWYGGTASQRAKFFEDANRIMQQVFAKNL